MRLLHLLATVGLLTSVGGTIVDAAEPSQSGPTLLVPVCTARPLAVTAGPPSDVGGVVPLPDGTEGQAGFALNVLAGPNHQPSPLDRPPT